MVAAPKGCVSQLMLKLTPRAKKNVVMTADVLAKLPGVMLDPATVETNIVLFELNGVLDATQAMAALRARGVRMLAMGPRPIRAVTHLDVTASQIERALEAAADALTEATP